MKRINSFLLLLSAFSSFASAQTASYDESAKTLLIPTLSASGKTYSNVTLSADLNLNTSSSMILTATPNDGVYQCQQDANSSTFYISVTSNNAIPSSCSSYSGTVRNSVVSAVAMGSPSFQFAVGCSVQPSSNTGSGDYFSGTGNDGKLVHLFFKGAHNFYWSGSTQVASCSKVF